MSTAPGEHELIVCLLAPSPWFQVFHHATDILAFLLPAALAATAGGSPPAALPPSQAYTFLSSLQAAIAGCPSPGSILQIPLPPRADYPFAAPAPIAITPPAPGAPSPRPLRIGTDFTEVQVPPQSATLGRSDPRHIVAPLGVLLHTLPPAALATLVAALLTERSCVFVAASPARAATAAAAASTLTAPLHWRAALLPLIPAARLGLLTDAQPVLAGLPAALRPLDAVPGCLEIDVDAGALRPPVGSADCCSRLLPGWARLCDDFTALKAKISAENDYTANAAITAAMHGFLAATIGTYHDYIRPAPEPERAGPGQTSTLSKGIMRALSAPIRFASGMSGRLSSSRRRGPRAAPAAAPPAAVFVPEDNIIYGEAGWRFHHDLFAAALSTPAEQDFAGALLKTVMWTKFIQERLSLMRQPARSGRTDAFELRVLAHLSTMRGRRTRARGAVAATHTKRGRRFIAGASFRSYGGSSKFDPYDPFAEEEDEDEFDEASAPQPAATAPLRARAATTGLLGSTSRLSGGSADAPGGDTMRKLGDISREHACLALRRRPQLYVGMQTAQAPCEAPSEPPAPAVGTVTGAGGLGKSSSVSSLQCAFTPSGSLPES